MVQISRFKTKEEFEQVMPALIDVLFSAYEDYPEYGVEDEKEAREYLHWLYSADPEGMFIAMVDSQIAGFIASHSQWWDKYIGVFVGEIHEISVKKDFHGMGIGSRLMGVAENYFRENGRHISALWVGVKNENAISFYEHKGYVRGEVRGPWLRMRKYLEGSYCEGK